MMKDDFAKKLRTLQVTVAGMCIGMLAFTVFATVSVLTDIFEIEYQPASLFLTVLGTMAVGELVAFLMLRQVMLKNIREQLEPQTQEGQRDRTLIRSYSTFTIIEGAMVEGLGLFGALIVLLTGRLEILVAPGLAIVLMIMLVFPTKDKFAGFVTAVTGKHSTLDQS